MNYFDNINTNNLTKKDFIRKNSFAIYGLGLTGLSVFNFLKKKKSIFFTWDDNKLKRKIFKSPQKLFFSKLLDKVDWIILSPGININNSIFKDQLKSNKKKIITDLDLFYINYLQAKSVMVTGTNGKSTTCEIINHIFKKTKIDTRLVGNIGKPILNISPKKDSLIIIEASSFQLAYSKFLRPNYAVILNIANDHLDWHGTKKEYIKSKFNIFSNQTINDFAFLSNKKLINLFKQKKYKAKLQEVFIDKYNKIQKKISNAYLNSNVNKENMSFVYYLAKKFKIKDNIFIENSNSFKGLAHRHEIFLNKNTTRFINDSKATSFDAAKNSIMNNKNIFWILGGLPKKNDKFYLKSLKKNIIKSFIIGKHINFFKKQLKNKVKFQVSYKIYNAVISILKEIRNKKIREITVLFSPAAASYDQFKNFEHRGDEFKKIVRNNARKYI